MNSHLAYMVTCGGATRFKRTTGVLPTMEVMSSCRRRASSGAAAGARSDDAREARAEAEDATAAAAARRSIIAALKPSRAWAAAQASKSD